MYPLEAEVTAPTEQAIAGVSFEATDNADALSATAPAFADIPPGEGITGAALLRKTFSRR